MVNQLPDALIGYPHDGFIGPWWVVGEVGPLGFTQHGLGDCAGLILKRRGRFVLRQLIRRDTG